MPAPARLAVRGLSKTFGSARVLADIELSVQPGEVHGLAGQNGSGKSTVIKILTGLHAPDPGARYEIDGRPVRVPVRWPEVHAAGVSVVYQDLGILDQLTVAENICVGGYPTSRLGRIDRRRRDELAVRTLDRLGIVLPPTRSAGSLPAAQRAEVAIARAMRDHVPGTGLIILDESTRALGGAGLEHVHQLLRRIAADGGAALVVSHSLAELKAVTDRVTVLRDGQVAGAGLRTADLTEPEIARLMLGASLTALSPRDSKRPRTAAGPAVAVTDLTGKQLAGASFEVSSGEILGITGLPGNGYEEIPYLITGARRAADGQLRTRDGTVRLAKGSVAACLRAGAVLVPERRDRDGLALELSTQDNISLPTLSRRGRPWFVAQRWQRDDAAAAARTLGIRPAAPALLVKQLSGGNQQKVLLAKWLSAAPALLVLHEPTQAVDIAARADILRALQRTADAGVAVLLVSGEPEALLAACDRILVYTREAGLRQSDAATPEQLIREIYATTEATAGSPT